VDNVTLVGHSYAGMVITGVADRLPGHLARLVYLDALVPQNGDAAVDLVAPQVREAMERQVRDDGDGWRIPIQRGTNDHPTHNVPHPFKTWTQPLRLGTAADAIPRVYIRCTADKQPGQFFALALETSWQRARAAGWLSVEVDTVHQITPDPSPKATALIDLLATP
jgi:pimeloyl-ACP methyl ester carboxylesterase